MPRRGDGLFRGSRRVCREMPGLLAAEVGDDELLFCLLKGCWGEGKGTG